ncbi:MAG: diguanylate cyclase [Clostridiales bacterium]|nr:diguanylate cyclase [Clostridiales bacterium]
MNRVQGYEGAVTILIADPLSQESEHSVRSAIKDDLISILLHKGYSVKTASSGYPEKDIEESQPDLILLCINENRPEAADFCKLLKLEEKLKNLPVIVAGCDIQPVDRACLYSSGASDFLSWPFVSEEVLTRIETQLLLSFTKQYNDNLLKENNDYRQKVFSLKQEMDEITKALKEFNITLEEEISEREKREAEIIYLSYHDKLTGLYNSRFFEEEVKRLDSERNIPLSVIMGDVNNLKLINDVFGHIKGDELLQKAAAAIKGSCREDDIIARMGGDEFAVLLPRTSPGETGEIVGRIRSSYSGVHVNHIGVSISFGWDTKLKKTDRLQKVMQHAEDNMYKNKTMESKNIRGNAINTIIKTFHENNPMEDLHAGRVSGICWEMARAMGLSDIEARRLKTAGMLHDIGKISIEEGLLYKPGKLDDREFNEIKRHSEIGYRILSASFDMLDLSDCILAHHERWDGTGYPKGISGEAIPKFARVIALADSYDAMTSDRPYRKAMSVEAAGEEIRKGAGTRYDPELAGIFLEKVLGKC